jgi:thiol-disulfide isomerase/thioredoxin
MRRLLLFALPSLLLGAARLAAQPDPRAILRTAAETAQTVRSVRLAYEHEMQYMSNPGVDTSRGTASAARDTNAFGIVYRFETDDGTVGAYDGNEMRSLEAGRDTIRVYDSTMGSIEERAGNGVMRELKSVLFTASRSIEAAMKRATEIRYVGLDTVGGVVCHDIAIAIADTDDVSGMHERWIIGVDDHLVRRRYDELSWNGMTQRWWLTITRLETNVALDRTLFTITPGKGMTAHYVRPEQYARPPLIAIGATAPGWTLADSLGTAVRSLADDAGKVVVLDFWGSWCGPCVMSLPELEKLHQDYAKRGVVVIGLSCNEPPGARPTWLMRSRGCTYPLVVDADSVARAYNVSAFPTTVIVGTDGTVVHTSEGFDPEAPYAKERAALDEYLKERGL